MVKLQYWQSRRPGSSTPAGSRTIHIMVFAEGPHLPLPPADDGKAPSPTPQLAANFKSSWKKSHRWSTQRRTSQSHCHSFGMQVDEDNLRHPVLPQTKRRPHQESTWNGFGKTSANTATKSSIPTPPS